MMKEKVDLMIIDAEEIATPISAGRPLAGEDQSKISVIKNGAIAISQGKIVAVGESQKIKQQFEAKHVISAKGRSVIPGFVDPHTHLVYAGCRHEEFELRLRGVPYVEILKKGGGIIETVRKTRNASEDELFDLASQRIVDFIAHGTTTVEIKSGYGLSYEDELKMLRVIARLSKETELDIVPTFLGMHAVPPEFRENRQGYVELVCERMLPDFVGLAEFVDVFMDEGAFTKEETERVFDKASQLGYKLKLHADELSSSGGAELAASYKAVSADHLVHISEKGIQAMAEAGTIAVLLPATTFMLRHKEYAPVRRLIDANVPVALATDHNPGTSPVISQAVVMGLATMLMGMTPAESLVAATLNAAFAVNRGHEVGSIEVGKKADILILKAHSYVHLVYEFGRNLVEKVIKNGSVIYES